MKDFVECMLLASDSSTMSQKIMAEYNHICADLLSFFLAEVFLGQIEW